jgi:hypothetical protein
MVLRNPDLSSIQFRPGQSDIKAYIGVSNLLADGSAGPLPLRRIVFGPTLRNDGVVADVLTLMLERYGYPDVPVEPSNMPYRL